MGGSSSSPISFWSSALGESWQQSPVHSLGEFEVNTRGVERESEGGVLDRIDAGTGVDSRERERDRRGSDRIGGRDSRS